MAAGRGKAGAVAERLYARKGTTGRGKGKELEEEEGRLSCAFWCSFGRGAVC